MQLRPYQQDASDAAIDWIKGCVDPCVIGAPTGAGKSYIIADVAERIREMSGKRVLVLAPSGELVRQDYEKYLLTGNPASMYSASGGRKETQYPVVFGSPMTVKNNMLRFGAEYAAVIIDEAHGITPTLTSIIDHMRGQNENLRVIGLSATPYRLGKGYIYRHHFDHGRLDDSVTVDPYFHSLIYDIDARHLIDAGHLTAPAMESADDHYDTSGLVLQSTGKWDAGTIDAAFVGHGRKTSRIVADIVARSQDRKGVMIFASTIKHAMEVMASLPPGLSALVTGETKAKERKDILARFKARDIKYLVNVSVLTTGFDAPHVDVIAILRATESASLLQQIIGRGLRVDAGKTNCLILDYAENIERHCPDGDVFAPDITARHSAGESDPVEAECPACHYINQFGARPNPDNFDIDKSGYFLDALGQRISTDHGDMPAHYGRRCTGESMVHGRHVRCKQKWTYKQCPECEHENDIAARRCASCGCEIVDPNEKLREIAAKIAKDPYRVRESNVTGWQAQRWPGKAGKPDTLRIIYDIDESPHQLSQWLAPESNSAWIRAKWHDFWISRTGEPAPANITDALSLFDSARCPARIAYRKKSGTRFFDIIAIGD